MTHDFPTNSASRNEETTLVVEESQTFVAFDRQMDDQLARLVALWIHAAAPNAKRENRRQSRFGR